MPSVVQLLALSADLPGESARRDAEILLCHVLDKPRTWLYTWPEQAVDAASECDYKVLLEARRRGQPIAHLTGRREFWSLNLRVNSHTLIPRPETETLVEWALQLNLPEEAAVLDLGTGSGAIALALAAENTHWKITALDASPPALEVACANAVENKLSNVSFLHSDWYEAVSAERFNLLVSNPPYIEPGDSHLSTGDLRFEPLQALMAKNQGLADLSKIIVGAPEHLHGGGWLLLEHGWEQGETVRALLQERGFSKLETRQDLAGHDRISGGCWDA